MIRFLHLFLAFLALFAGNAQAIEIRQQITIEAERSKPMAQPRFVTSVVSPEGALSYEYDKQGRKTRTSSAATDIRYEYDKMDRLAVLKVLKQYGQTLAQPQLYSWTYDALGRKASLSRPGGLSTSFGNYLATGDAALALIGMVPFGAWSSTPRFAAAAAKAGAIGSKGLAGAREALNASRLAKAINCGPVARGLARNGWITARCFPGDTLASGKRMDQYRKDELLTAWDDAKKTFVQARITQIFVHEHDGEFAEVTLTSGASLKPTAEHPFRLAQPEQLAARPSVVFDAPQEGTWVEARYLRTGDLLLTPKGPIAVASVRVYQDKIKVYNFEVEGLHNYTVGADGVVVHNACAHTAAFNDKHAAYAKYVQRNGKNALGIQAWAQGVSRPAGSLGYTAGMARHSQNLRSASTHGNSIGSQQATLYAKLDKEGLFLKWGITKHANPSNRYPAHSYTNSKGKFIEGRDKGEILRIGTGPRFEMVNLERALTERFPGIRNLEPWSGQKMIMPGVGLFW